METQGSKGNIFVIFNVLSNPRIYCKFSVWNFLQQMYLLYKV